MFSPNLASSRQKMPSSVSRVSSQQKSGRRTSNIITPQRKPATPLFGRNKSLNVSELPSGITELGPEHVLSDYGTPLPVAVTEALTQLQNDCPSAKLDPNGWVWLVCGRKLIIWNFKNVPHNKTGCCYELLLPSSNFPHNADLVKVFVSSDRQSVASCLAVSPEGTARYWNNISLENSYTELSITLRGENCIILTSLLASDAGFVVGTISSTLIHIGWVQGQLKYRVLKSPQGMLSGIGRRVSSLFGSSQQQTSNSAPLYQLLAGETLGPETQSLYVLTGGNLQKWAVSFNQEKLLYEFAIDGLFRERLAGSVWKKDASTLPEFNTWTMDIELVRDGLIVLGAGVNRSVSSQVYYAIGILCTDGEDAPHSFSSFTVTGHHGVYETNKESRLWSRLLVPNLLSAGIFIYNRETIVCVTDGRPEETPDVVEFPNLGAGCSNGLPVFVSNQGHLVKIQETMTDFMASAVDVLSKTASFAKLDTSIAATANSETINKMSMSTDRSSRLKAAFLASIRDASHQLDAQKIVEDLFPTGVTPSQDPGSLLDTLVVGLSQEMIDDYPASDPRWAESLPPGSASSYSVSLILLHQLDDKQKAHELFLCFLKNYGLWDKLTLISVRDGVMLTRMLLCEHAEKIEAAKALRNLHTEHVEVVDRAIESVLSRRQLVPFNNLTPQDLFYREVSRISDILPCLVEYIEERLSSETSSSNIISLISAANTIIKGMIYAANHYRLGQTSIYDSNAPVSRKPEFVPWTSSTGPRGVRSVIRKQFDLTVDRGLPETQSNQEKGILFQQLLDLADMLLDGYRVQLDSLKARFHVPNQPDAHYLEVLRKFEQERTTVIAPFTTHHQYERATSLAEKYCDFATLVQLCDDLDNPERLQMYMHKFHDQGFSDFVFQWHMNAGKRGKLLKSDYVSNPSLARFLQSKENKFMSWLHDISANNYNQAHRTLLELGQEETQYLAQKKTLLSLSKLAALASVERMDTNISDNIELINNEQDLILHQDQLMSCQEVRESLAIDNADNMKVLTVPEMIELYIGDYNVNANEFDFKKALDLTTFIDKENPELDWHSILLQIWSKAILRDRWNQPPSATDPIAPCRDTIFFKMLDLIINEDGNLDELLPNADDLLSSDFLGDLRHRRDFQCLLRAIYEHISRRMQVDA